jgi:cytochrome c heme-lyase
MSKQQKKMNDDQPEKDRGGCPVKHNNDNNNKVECPIKINNNENNKNGNSIFNWLGFNSKANSNSNNNNNNNNNNNDKYNEAAGDIVFGQEKQKNQIATLSTTRNVSSIPKSDYTPGHQPEGVDQWVYPSEQQYYNAMKRKGYNVNESDVSAVLAIHNLVNEEGWSRVKEWESIRGDHIPKLKQFIGRPNDISPKAYLRNIILGQKLPFDRHDWFIDRNGKEVIYIIDFYKGASRPNAAISIFLDVRPAIDSPQALFDVMSNIYRNEILPLYKYHYNKYIKK